MEKVRGINGDRLVNKWLELPDYDKRDTDIEFKWGLLADGSPFIMDTIDSLLRKWKKDPAIKLLDIFNVFEIYREPRSDFDAFFKGPDRLVARFETRDGAMMWKLIYG